MTIDDTAPAREDRARQLSTLMERTQNLVVVTDRAGSIEWVNASFTQLTGYTLDEVRGKRPGTVLHGPDTDPATIALMREHLRAVLPFRTEVLNYTKAGVP